MHKNKITLSFAVALACGMSSTSALAAGFQLAENSATGLGRAFAGEAAMADNASTQFRNPAMLTSLSGTQVSAGAINVNPNVDVKGTTTAMGLELETQSRNIAHSAVIPNFYLSHQLNDKVTLGLALGTHFGMRTDLGTDFLGAQFGNKAEVHTMEINPNLAYKINDQFSVGAGLRYVIGKGHIGAASPITLPINEMITIQKGQSLKYMEGDDNTWGWQVGAAWQLNPSHRFGVSYHSAVTLDLEGHANGIAFDKAYLEQGKMPQAQYGGSLPLELPASVELASYHQLTERWAVHSSINWTDWSTFKQLKANIPNMPDNIEHIKDENWKDNYRFAVGTTYQVNDELTLRTGIAYDMAAVDDAHRTQTIPETDRTWFSVGAGYQWSDNLNIDAGLTYIHAKKAPMLEKDKQHPEFGQFAGKTSGDIWLVGVQTSYRF